MVPSGSKGSSQPQVPKAVVKKVEKVEKRPFYLVVHRQRKEDPWLHKGVGQEFFRDREFAVSAIPPNATESYILEFELPI